MHRRAPRTLLHSPSDLQRSPAVEKEEMSCGSIGPLCYPLGRKWVETRHKNSAAEEFHPVMPFERSEEHTSELQSRSDLVCRLLLEKKKKTESLRKTSTISYPS